MKRALMRWAIRPAWDFVALLPLLGVAWVRRVAPGLIEQSVAFTEVTATALGLIAAVTTFICGSFWSSPSNAVRRMRTEFGVQFRRVWTSVIGTPLALAVVCILFLGAPRSVAVAVTVSCLFAGSLSGARALVWFWALLTQQQKAAGVMNAHGPGAA